MEPDPILEELWRIKDEIAAEHDYDVDRLIDDLARRRKVNEAKGVEYVTLAPRRIKPQMTIPSRAERS